MKKPYIASLVNSIVLISFGLWAYLSSNSPSLTTLIPVFIGILILMFNKGLKKEKKIPSHIVAVLTVIVLIGLIKPLLGVLERNSLVGIARVAIMMLSTIIALLVFIKSFADVRRKRR